MESEMARDNRDDMEMLRLARTASSALTALLAHPKVDYRLGLRKERIVAAQATCERTAQQIEAAWN